MDPARGPVDSYLIEFAGGTVARGVRGGRVYGVTHGLVTPAFSRLF